MKKNRWLGLALAAAMVFLCTTGCGFMHDSDGAPKEVHPAAAKKLASRISSSLLDMTHLRGKVLGAGPGVAASDDGNGEYGVQHFWSITNLSPDELTHGFERLREELPKKGWRVTHFGHANSEARQLEMEAVHEKDEYSLSVELLIRSTRKNQAPYASKEDMIHFSVGSPTYRSPKGVDPNGYY